MRRDFFILQWHILSDILKIRDALVKFIEELKSIVKSLAWDERAALDEQVEMLDAIRLMFNKALENVDTNKNTARTDGGVKYSIGDAKVPTYEELINKPDIKVVDISKPKTTGTFRERRKQILENAREIIKKPYHNKDTNAFIFLTSDSYSHLFSNHGELQLNAAEHFPEFIESAVLTHSMPNNHGSKYAKNVYTFFSAAGADKIHPVKLKVKEYDYAGQQLPVNIKEYFDTLPDGYLSVYDMVVLEVENIEESLPGSANNKESKFPFLSPDKLPSKISISDLIDLVNGNAKKYIPTPPGDTKNNYHKMSLQTLNSEYMSAVENGDTETAQKYVDEAAACAGYTARMFHETKADNIHVFDISRSDNSGTDNETPYGIFTKSRPEKIGLGDRQLELYVKANKTLVVANRADIKNKIPGLSEFYDKLSEIDEYYSAISEELEDEEFDALSEWMDEHPDADMDKVYPNSYIAEGKPADINSDRYKKAFDDYEKNMKKWKAAYAEIAVQSKSLITSYLRSNGYDSMYIQVDEGSFGRKTDSLIVLDSNQVKSAEAITYDDNGKIIPLDKRFDEKKTDIRFSFAGPKARTANQSLLGKAIKLENAGKLTKEEIRKQTGWFRGYDGKWRFEIDDSKMKVSTSGKYSRNPDIRRYQELTEKIYFEDNATEEEHNEFRALRKSLDGVSTRPRKLGDLIEHDELFAAYPQLENVSFRLEKDTGTANGWYSEFDNEIVVRQSLALKPEELKKTLIHEIQHAIQHIENFSAGSNPEFFEDYEDARYNTLAYRNYVKAENRLKAYMQYAKEDISDILGVYNSETIYLGLTQSEYSKAYDIAAKQIQDENLLDVFWDYAIAREELYTELSETENETPRESYKKTAGEIEARDAAKRLNYSAEQRKNIRPDIDRSDVIFADGVGESYSLEDIDKYTEKEYNDYGWIAVNEVLTGNEINSLYSQFADATKLNFKYPKSSANEYMILVGDTTNSYDHLVYIKGDINHPIITQVVGVYSDIKKYQKNYLEEVIILNEKKVGNTLRIIEEYAEEEIFFRYTLQDYHSYNELQTERSGTRSVDNSRGKQNGRGSSGKNPGSGIKFSLQETSDAAKAREELLKANDNLRVANTVLKNELKTTHGKTISMKDAEKIAKQMLREFDSKYDSAQLAESIYNIFQYYDSEDNNTDYVIDYIITVAKDQQLTVLTCILTCIFRFNI